jgi:small subunit ribosomal protein S27Ae
MHILIRTLTGKTCELTADKTTSIDSIYSQVQRAMGVPAEEQNLIFNGKSLESGKFVLDYEMGEEENVYLVVKLSGGAKGKKKKKDVKKNKKKHKKRKVKLAILKYYRVEDGKVLRLKQMCKVCPAGTFIAEHADRLYCGRCHAGYAKIADNKKGGKADAGKGGKKK